MTYYGVATISRLLKNTGLFWKRALQKRPIFAKETYIFKEPTNRSHPILRLFTTTTTIYYYYYYLLPFTAIRLPFTWKKIHPRSLRVCILPYSQLNLTIYSIIFYKIFNYVLAFYNLTHTSCSQGSKFLRMEKIPIVKYNWYIFIYFAISSTIFYYIVYYI